MNDLWSRNYHETREFVIVSNLTEYVPNTLTEPQTLVGRSEIGFYFLLELNWFWTFPDLISQSCSFNLIQIQSFSNFK